MRVCVYIYIFDTTAPKRPPITSTSTWDCVDLSFFGKSSDQWHIFLDRFDQSELVEVHWHSASHLDLLRIFHFSPSGQQDFSPLNHHLSFKLHLSATHYGERFGLKVPPPVGQLFLCIFIKSRLYCDTIPGPILPHINSLMHPSLL